MVHDDKPFRIVVSIIRGTTVGRALELMSSGMRCASETLEGAKAIVSDFEDAASAPLGGCDEGIVFGMVAILNTKTGTIEYTSILKS